MRKSLAGNGMALLLIALCGLFLACEKSWFFLTPEYTFSNVSSAAFGREGYLLVVDRGKAAVELVNPGRNLEVRYRGSRLFDSVEHAVQGEDGTIYVADRSYEDMDDESGKVRLLERVLEIQGSRSRVLWQDASTMGADASRMRYPILEMQVWNGELYFLRRQDYGLGLYKVDKAGEHSLVREIYCGDVIDDASIDLDNNTLVITARRGFIRWTQGNTGNWATLYADDAEIMPQNISARGGVAYFTDIRSDRLCKFIPGEPSSLQTVLAGTRLESVALSDDGRQVVVSSTGGFWVLGENGTHLTEQVPVSSFPVTVMTWLALATLILCVLWLLRRVPGHIGKVFRRESAVRALLVVLAAASVSAFVGYSLLSELFVQEDTALVDNMKLFAETLEREVDTASLEQVEYAWDYGSSAYQKVRQGLDGLAELAWSENNYYSYALYHANEQGEVLYVLDYDDTVKCGQPYIRPDKEYFLRVLDTGSAFALHREDSYGARTSLLLPVTGVDGTRQAVLEVSLDMALRDRARATTVFNMLLNVLCSTAVVVMLVMEGLFLLSFSERRRKLRQETPEQLDGPSLVPVRTLMCLSYLADAMQDAFIAILCGELYQGGLPLPEGVAVALPLSAQLLTMAVASALAGRFAERWGSRPLLVTGMATQLAGSLICLALGSYYGLLIGKVLIGAGMGMIYVTCNTVAASGKTEESVATGFAGVSAGTLSGVTIGGGLSSVFLSIGGWRMIYLIGAIALTAGLLLALSSQSVRSSRREGEWEKAVERQDISVFRFLFNRRVLGFFVLVLVPFMMALSYREYFFPLFAQEKGMGEVRIGQVYLLCGLLVIYLGPRLSQWLLRRLGSLGAVLVSSTAMGLNMLLFVIWPGLVTVLAGVVILSVVISFAYTCQYTFVENLPDSAMFGQGKAMGVYSVFESLGQTAGPVVYGAVLALGQRRGILLLSVATLGLLGIYLLSMWRTRNLYR